MSPKLPAKFPISRDPPEGGTTAKLPTIQTLARLRFQFLGIPPKGELALNAQRSAERYSFQFLGIPPKGELYPY